MRALYYEQLGGYQRIRAGKFPRPEIGDHDVLVRVRAFSLNHLDVWVMEGKLPLDIPLPHIFASDASGIVEKAGRDVNHVSPGDEVVVHPGLSCGSCEQCLSGRDNECRNFSILGVLTPGVSAEYVRVPVANVLHQPKGLSPEEASAIGITYATAWNLLVLRGGIRQGDVVFIHGGSGGAGTALIQVAKLYHATVITSVGDDWKIEKAKGLGAHHVINYKQDDFAEGVKRITKGEFADIAVDHIGADTLQRTLAIVKRGGRVITFGATSGDEVSVSLRSIFGRNITVHGVYLGPQSAVCTYLRLFPRHLKPVIDSVFAFNDVHKAYEKLLSRQFFGKIVVKI
ncbi:MAG: zinc-binding dehydrogenase [bacterium]